MNHQEDHLLALNALQMNNSHLKPNQKKKINQVKVTIKLKRNCKMMLRTKKYPVPKMKSSYQNAKRRTDTRMVKSRSKEGTAKIKLLKVNRKKKVTMVVISTHSQQYIHLQCSLRKARQKVKTKTMLLTRIIISRLILNN